MSDLIRVVLAFLSAMLAIGLYMWLALRDWPAWTIAPLMAYVGCVLAWLLLPRSQPSEPPR